MATVNIKDQVKIAFSPINIAQINEALITYAASSVITDGLNELKNTILSGIDTPKDCVQCVATGKITVNAIDYFCPLCGGNTKTSGQYKVLYPAPIGFQTV